MRLVVTELCSDLEDSDMKDNTNRSRDTHAVIILSYARRIRDHVRDTTQYRSLMQYVLAVENQLNAHSLDSIINHLFEHTETNIRRITNSCIFMILIADIIVQTDDKKKRKTLLIVSATLIARKNLEVWQELMNTIQRWRCIAFLKFGCKVLCVGLALWACLKGFRAIHN